MTYVGFSETISTNTSGEVGLNKINLTKHADGAIGVFNKCYQFLSTLDVTIAAASNAPKLDVSIQQSLDHGATWQEFLAFTQVTTSTGDETLSEQDADSPNFAGDLKLVWDVTGGSAHGTLTNDPTGINNKYTVTGKQTIPSDDNATSFTVVEGAAGAAISVAVDEADITVTLAKSAGVAATLSTALAGSNNDLTYTARAVGTAGNSYAVVYDNTAVQSATKANLSGTTLTVLLRSAITRASLSTALAGANNDLVFTAVSPVAAVGNAVHIVYVDPNLQGAISVGVVGSVITVTLANDAGPDISSTASQVKAAIEASAAASALVTVALKSPDTGAGLVTALADTPLAGGNDKTIVATAAEVLGAVVRNYEFTQAVKADIASANDGTGVVTALASTPLATGAAPAVTSTTGNVITAVAANVAANALVGVTNFAANDGTGLCAAVAKAYLTNFGAEVYEFNVRGFGK